jgi:hypothetical protein
MGGPGQNWVHDGAKSDVDSCNQAVGLGAFAGGFDRRLGQWRTVNFTAGQLD